MQPRPCTLLFTAVMAGFSIWGHKGNACIRPPAVRLRSLSFPSSSGFSLLPVLCPCTQCQLRCFGAGAGDPCNQSRTPASNANAEEGAWPSPIAIRPQGNTVGGFCETHLTAAASKVGAHKAFILRTACHCQHYVTRAWGTSRRASRHWIDMRTAQ